MVDIPAWKDEKGGGGRPLLMMFKFETFDWQEGSLKGIYIYNHEKKTNLSLLNSSCQTDFGNGLINSETDQFHPRWN